MQEVPVDLLRRRGDGEVAFTTISPTSCTNCDFWGFLIFGSRITIYSSEPGAHHRRFLVLDSWGSISGNKNPWPPSDVSSPQRCPSPASHCANHCSFRYPSSAARSPTIYAFWGRTVA